MAVTPEQMIAAVEQHGSFLAAAKALGVGDATVGRMTLPPAHTPEWRLHVARQMIRAGYQSALNYLECADDPRPMHTAAQAIWQEAIERTAQAVPANDRAEFAPLLGDEGD